MLGTWTSYVTIWYNPLLARKKEDTKYIKQETDEKELQVKLTQGVYLPVSPKTCWHINVDGTWKRWLKEKICDNITSSFLITYTKGSGCGPLNFFSSARVARHKSSVARCAGAGSGDHRTVQLRSNLAPAFVLILAQTEYLAKLLNNLSTTWDALLGHGNIKGQLCYVQ